jgi:hypothetical protein
LSFNGIQETLTIPFSALTAFVDPSVKFALQFTPSFGENDSPSRKEKSEISENASGEEGKIISFDSFRKK